MFQGIDESRAEAVMDVFFGLAMEDATGEVEKAMQLWLLAAVADLDTWEVVTLNQIERYHQRVYDEVLAEKISTAMESGDRETAERLRRERSTILTFEEFLREQFPDNLEYVQACRQAVIRLDGRSADGGIKKYNMPTLNLPRANLPRAHLPKNSSQTDPHLLLKDDLHRFSSDHKGAYTPLGVRVVDRMLEGRKVGRTAVGDGED